MGITVEPDCSQPVAVEHSTAEDKTDLARHDAETLRDLRAGAAADERVPAYLSLSGPVVPGPETTSAAVAKPRFKSIDQRLARLRANAPEIKASPVPVSLQARPNKTIPWPELDYAKSAEVHSADEVVEEPLRSRLRDIKEMKFLPGGGFITVSIDGRNATVWDDENRQVATLSHQRINSVAKLTNGHFVTGGFDGRTIKIWDNRGKSLNTFAANEGAEVVATLPNGDFVTTCWSGAREAWVWDEAGNRLAELVGHTNIIRAAAVLPDGCIVTASQDRTAKIWDRTGHCRATLTGHSEMVRWVAVLPDGRIVTASDDGIVKIWNEKGECLKTLSCDNKRINSMIVLPDGHILTATYKKGCSIWDSEGQYITTLPDSTDMGYLVALPGGRVAGKRIGTPNWRVWTFASAARLPTRSTPPLVKSLLTQAKSFIRR